MVANNMAENKVSSSTINDEQALIVETMMTWARAFSATSANSIVALYAKDASLWGTFSSAIRRTPESIRDYFDKTFIFANRKVTFNNFNIRFYGSTAISSGLYTFSLVKAGQQIVVPARYSFTYVKHSGGWLIAEHHSSVMPVDL